MMVTKNIILIGSGGHAKVVIDIIEKQDAFRLVGILDPQIAVGEKILGYPILGRDEDLPTLMKKHAINGVVLGIGDNWLRSKIVTSLKSNVPELQFPNAVHPSAQFAKDVQFGHGNVVMAGCSINTSAVIGDFCVLNTNCSLDHDGRMGDYSSLAPNSCAGGLVEIGEFSAICLGANVAHNVKIGAHTIVGAGATVLGDLPSHVLAFGTPAKLVRTRSEGERYL